MNKLELFARSEGVFTFSFSCFL